MRALIEDDNINYEYIIRYLRDSIPERQGLLKEMEEFAHTYSVPISQPESIRFIEVLLKIKPAEKILEVGTAIGYSAIIMAKASGGEVTTIELSDDAYRKANEFISRSDVAGKINVIHGDANEVLPDLEGSFDFIFVDAAKGQYNDFLPHCMRLLKKGGVLVSDNILYKGMTATDELLTHRKITIVKRLRSYIETLKESKELSTAIIPIGDGIALSFKEV
ncbi:MAG: O-methyltransferase [Clostridia bacterium]|nr:O-methyltransferase [Clostridia bacterium]